MSHASATVSADMRQHGGGNPMMNPRLAIASVALVAALGLTGCGPGDGSTASTGGNGSGVAAQRAAEKVDPAADLAAAAQKVSDQSMKIDMDMAGAMSMTGVADPKSGNAKMSKEMGALDKDTYIVIRSIGDVQCPK